MGTDFVVRERHMGMRTFKEFVVSAYSYSELLQSFYFTLVTKHVRIYRSANIYIFCTFS